MKIVIEAEEIRKLVSMYVKQKLKCDIDFASSDLMVEGQRVSANSDHIEFKLVVKIDEKAA